MERTNNTELNNLIARWLSGEADAAELAKLSQWASESGENEKYLKEIEKIWDAAGEEHADFNTLKAWQKIQTDIHKKKPASRNLKIIYRSAWIAAACLTVFITGRYFFRPKTDMITLPVASTGLFIQAGNEEYTTTLGDQTVVRLQPHSTITADTGFGSAHRTLKLKGSAHFITVHGNKHIFTVQTEKTTVEDIGTAFWVIESAGNTSVRVTEGSVKVKSGADSAILVKGDSAAVSHGEGTIRIPRNPVQEPGSAEAEKDKTLVFIKTELNKVTPLLKATYQVDVRLGNKDIETCKLTATFKNESLETVLEVIRETFNLEIRREGAVIYLDGKGCQ